jgi:hypothetical protein
MQLELKEYLFPDISSLDSIKKSLSELCCDEYYEYLEEIDDEIYKYIGNNIKYVLLFSSLKNNSIKSFEYIIKKFEIKIDKNFNIFHNNKKIKNLPFDGELSNLKNNFTEYILDNYDATDKVDRNTNLYLNRDYDLIKKIKKKTEVLTENDEYRLLDACSHNQIKIIKYYIEEQNMKIDVMLLKAILLRILVKYNSFTLNQNYKMYTIEYFYKRFPLLFTADLINKLLKTSKCKDIMYYKWFEEKNIILEQNILLRQLYFVFTETKIDYELLFWLYKRISDKDKIDYIKIFTSCKTYGNDDICEYLIDTNKIGSELFENLHYNDSMKEYYEYRKVIDYRKEFVEYHYNKFLNAVEGNTIFI